MRCLIENGVKCALAKAEFSKIKKVAQSRITPPLFRPCPKWLDTVGNVGILASRYCRDTRRKTVKSARRRSEQG